MDDLQQKDADAVSAEEKARLAEAEAANADTEAAAHEEKASEETA